MELPSAMGLPYTANQANAARPATVSGGRTSRRLPSFWALACPILLAPMLLVWSVAPALAMPAGFQEYYILGNETQVLHMFEVIQQGGTSPGSAVASTITVVATTDHQVVYYDHWEDGYEPNILHPVQATTEAYGDGVPQADLLRAGDIIRLTSDGSAGGIHGFVPVPRGTELRYDSGDRLVSVGGPLDIAHSVWPGQYAWIGGAWEIYPVGAWPTGHSYIVPIGEELYDGPGGYFPDLQHIWLEIQALDDNTTVHIDNGLQAISVRLDRGQHYSSMGYTDGSTAGIPAISVRAGTAVLANKPIQGGLVTGCQVDQTRFFSLVPDTDWGTEYVAPIPRTNATSPAEVYLYNPNTNGQRVTAYDGGALTGTSFVLPARTTLAYQHPSAVGRYVPTFSGLRLSSAGPLWAVISADAGRVEYNWGFSMVPTRYAGQDFYVSWAPSSDGTHINASPVWVSPLSDNTTFSVDYSSPGVDGIHDQRFMLDSLGLRRIWDPTDGDNTGMHIWADKPFVAVWGEDPAVADSVTGLDIGYPVLPVTGAWLDTVLDLDKTPEIQAVPYTGGVAPFSLRASAFRYPVSNVQITDTLPANWTYVPGSTSVIYPDGHTTSMDPTVIGQALAWPMSAGLAPNQSLTVTFQARFTPTSALGDTRYDDFESGGYAGGTDWSSPWTEYEPGGCGGNCAYTTTAGLPHSGRYHLAVTGSSAAISRTADLSGFQQPALRFWRSLDSVESGDAFYVRVYDGAMWRTVLTLTVNSGLYAYMGEQLDLTPYRSTNFALELRTDPTNAADDYLYLDDVEIVDLAAIHTNAAEATGVYLGYLFSSRDTASAVLSPFDLQYRVDSPVVVGGDQLTYSLVYTNSSQTLTATNAMIRAVLPANTLFLSASPGSAYVPAANTIVWGQAPSMTLAPGASGTVTMAVTVDTWASSGQVLRSQVYMDCDQTPEIASNPVESLVHAPMLSVTKSGPASANAGQVTTYTIHYANTGLYTATGVIITDLIPVSTTYQAESLALNTGSGFQPLTDGSDGDAGAFTGSAIAVLPGRLIMGQVGPGEAGDVRFAVYVGLVAAGGNIANYATLVRDYARPQNSELLLTMISDLTLAKSADRSLAGPGAGITYTIALGSSGTLSQTEVYLYDSIPAHTRYLPGSAVIPPGFLLSYSIDSGLTWTSTLPVTPSQVTNLRWYTPAIVGAVQFALGYAVQVEDPMSTAGVVIFNRARATSTQTPLLYSNEVRLPTIDPNVHKVDQGAPVSPGQRITYTIVYGNRGSAAAPGTVISDHIPRHTNLVPGSITGMGVSDGQVVTWTLDLPAQSSAAVQFAVAVTSPLPAGVEVVTNTVYIVTASGFAATHTLTTTVASAAELSMAKTASAASIASGDTLTYTLLLSNTGKQDATGVVVTDALPALVSFVQASDNGVPGDGIVTWPAVNLDGQSSLTRTVTVRLADPLPTVADVLVNSAIATGYDRAGSLITATAIHSTTIDFSPAIRITKNGPLEAKLGETVIYTFTLANVSFTPTAASSDTRGDGSPIHNIVITDSIASPVYYTGGDDGDGLLEVSEAWVYTASHTVRDTDPDPLENIGTVTGRDTNGDLMTATDRHQLDIQYRPALQIQADGSDTARVGDIVTLTLVVTNDTINGDGSAVVRISVTDTLLSDIQYVGGDNGDGLLLPGESWWFDGHHQVLPTDPILLTGRSTAVGYDRDGDLVNASCIRHLHVEWDTYLTFLPALLNR